MWLNRGPGSTVMDNGNSSPKRRRGIYLLPNLFTTANLFCGFYAIIAAEAGRFEAAAIAIFVAALMDGLDGRVARLTNTQSDFGVEYDSLTDMVSFGVAPAMIMYQWALSDLGDYGWLWAKIGWLGAFIYTAAAALRLARFNTQVGVADKRYFQGLPSPAAAALVASAIWAAVDRGLSGAAMAFQALAITVAAGLLMVSNFRYNSFKEFDLHKPLPFVKALVIALLFPLVALEPSTMLFALFLGYAVSGPLLTFKRLRERRAERVPPRN
jgi:CDP-diacylglycerol---serine O-phosphatidyltransferase